MTYEALINIINMIECKIRGQYLTLKSLTINEIIYSK